MISNNISEALTYLSDEPDVQALNLAYDQTVNELESYFDLCRTSYDERRNFWPGKSRDHRKHGADAFPWEGASDIECHIIDERITRLVALFMSSLRRASVRAFPVESGDIQRSKLVSGFLKWMVSSGYIPRFYREMELGANYLLERGILITYIGWHREDRTFKQLIDLNQIAEISPEAAMAIQTGDSDEELILLLQNAFDGVTEKRAKKALKQLRKEGVTELPIVKRQVNSPEVKTLAPDGDFFFPPYVTDPQRAPYCFWKTYYTAQELQTKVSTDDWDEDFVDYIISKYRGVNVNSIERAQEGRRDISLSDSSAEADELIEIVYGYQRLIDEEDGSEGIYCTIFHKDFSGDNIVPGYAKFELLNGYEDYPVVVTRLSEDTKRLYDTQTIPDILRGIQNQVKVEKDSRIDRNSLATLPPILHPVGQAPSDWGPGRMIPYRRKGDLDFAPTPAFNQGSLEMETNLTNLADRLVGLDEESQMSSIRQQFLVDKFLSHTAEVLRMAFKCFQRFGPDEVFFQVTGVPDSQVFDKGNPDENFDILINFDVLNADPDTIQNKLKQFAELAQFNTNNRMSMDNFLDIAASAIDPVMADAILQPVENAQEEVVKQVTDDLAKIFAGIEMPARQSGAQIAMQVIQEYTQQPDIAQRAATDEAFSGRLQKYVGQYTFQMQQAQNAEIGRLGTAPAQMGEVDTQQM
tara:strand:+ start:1352 stop:3436 length:2085 start_codon:yes stop_codon:yes gene_type:complete